MAFRYHKYGFIISIDFGTTFSGTCYSVTSGLSVKDFNQKTYPEITQVTSWPEQSTEENKTPSITIYDRNFHLLYWGKAARSHIENGYLKPGEIVKERFKLKLPSSVPQKGAIYKTNNAKKTEHDNMRATIDYFREIFDHTVSTIKLAISSAHISVEKENIRFVITVPAEWNDVQRVIMRTVAKESGLITDADHENRLLIINESSAATLHCEQRETSMGALKPGDKYIICDAGGGTVDLATFESVKNVIGDPPGSFRRCQLTADSGKECGSTFIDKKLRELLTKYCYQDKGVEIGKEEEKKREKFFSPEIDKFITNYKINFGKRSMKFKFDECNHLELLESGKFDLPVEDTGEGDPDDNQCYICKLEDFKYIDRKNFGDSITIVLRDSLIVPTLHTRVPKTVKCTKVGGTCTLVIPYSIIRKEVFDPVVDATIELINRQIKKANGGISRTYLVGGFGGSPYLRKKILKTFYKKDSNFPNSEFESGQLITDTAGNSAAMRGAMVYGIDGSRRSPQTDVVEKTFECASTDEYNTLICLDIGYLTTSCSYRNLKNESNEMTDITDWPGLQEDSFMIPTTKETVDKVTSWGAQVNQLIGSGHNDHNDRIASDHTKFISPSKLMSIAKADLRHYLCEYLKLVLGHVHKSIAKADSQLTDKSKYRYVITMENCYQFFNSKSEMRYIAQLAGIVSKEDSFGRLLLIGRDNATAMYNEKRYFSDKDANANHILQINMYNSICNLSLMEHTKLSGTDIDSKYTNEDNQIKLFRNVRSVRSATFDFDFIGRIVSNLNNYISTNTCIECNKGHETYNPTYYAELRRGFLEYIKTSLNFDNNDETQDIPTTDTGCCIASIKVYDLLEYVFRPAAKDFASEINRFATQADMTQRFSFDNILLSGFLLEANESNYEFLERIVFSNISEAMGVETSYIKRSDVNGKEALLGAAIYGNCPTYFTERVARTSYAVNIRAYRIKEFEEQAQLEIKNEIKNENENEKEKEKEKNKNEKALKRRIYDIESTFGHVNDEKVDLFYQSPHNPSLYTTDFDRKDDDLTYLIRRGDKILEKDQKKGIFKKFYAHEDCIVYATIYSSEADDLPTEGVKTNNPHFRKIHQFELYVKRDEDDPMTAGKKPRLHFDIRLIPDNNEAKFEARVGSRLGKKIPEYRFRDEFLVANIYDDRQLTEVGDLTIKDEATADNGVSTVDEDVPELSINESA
ncbi:hypothetical protein INT48_006144 [Thamnidium elegans]|uniref:Uncharacterized protein n=1 Tax=Thamnidium elegans TaxID=101142 RepID=A0A8H7SXU3_9FUNG|nr:hypothetical protein INT48_006144 [Thamnidium elegans]